LAIGCAICFTVLRRTAGRVLLWLAWATAAAVVVQFTLGKLEIADWHIFLGVLIAMLTTALTSWTYRRPPPTG
jgi:branched-subunit amino acid ABC-type transport system permease component